LLVLGGSKGYALYLIKREHDGDDPRLEGSRGANSARKVFDPVQHRAAVQRQRCAQLREEGRQWRELGDVARERVDEADGASLVLVPQQQQEAVDRVDGAVVVEEREPGADQGARVEVEEASVPA